MVVASSLLELLLLASASPEAIFQQTIEVKILPFMPPGFVLSFPVSFLAPESPFPAGLPCLDIFFAFGSENIVLLTHKVTANNNSQQYQTIGY